MEARVFDRCSMSQRHPLYLDRLRAVADRYQAADLIRACAAHQVAHLPFYTDAERMQIVIGADRQACQLERDWLVHEDSDEFMDPPWQLWLKQWGYV